MIFYFVSKPVRIAYLIGELFSAHGPGGSEKQLLLLLSLLDRRQVDPVLIVWNSSGSEGLLASFRELNIRSYLLKAKGRLGRLKELCKALREANVDYIHTYSFYLNFPGWVATQFTKTKSILGTLQSDYFGDVSDMSPIFSGLCSRYPGKIISNNQLAINNIKKNLKNADRLKLWHFPNRVGLEKFSPAKQLAFRERRPTR